MERKGLVEGQEVKVTERVNGSLYSYIVEPSVAMSEFIEAIREKIRQRNHQSDQRETERDFTLLSSI